MNPGLRQVEARTRGTEKGTISFLTNNHMIAITIFILAIMSANIWTETLVKGIAKIFNVKQEELDFVKWLIFASIFTLFTYFVIVYIFKVPITAAFGL